MLVIFGAEYLIWPVVGIALIWFLKQSKEKQKKVFLFAFLCLPITYAAAKFISLFYFHPQPFVTGNFVPLIPHEPDNSFPSDHTLLSAALAAVIYPFKRNLSIVLWISAVLIGASRILAGVHYFVDVAGSMAVAIVSGFLAYQLFKVIRFS